MKDMYGRPLKAEYDYVVIGSGSAGAVVASRLAEDASKTVLLVEAGPKDSSIYIRMPAAFGFPLVDDKYNWYLHSEPEPYLNNRKIYEARGRVLGGSSSINGMNWVRGNPWDYDNWAALGNKGWSYAEVLPYFKKAETFSGGADTYRGDKGPMQIETCKAENLMYKAFLEAGKQYGLEHVEDHNGYKQEGVHITQRNVHAGLRWSTSRAYLHSQPKRQNLHVAILTFAEKIEFTGKRATSVRLVVNGEKLNVRVGREAILCSGALHSPHLLMHSGIGDQAQLEKLGIKVVHHLPGVGEGLKDHTAAPVQYSAKLNDSAAKEFSKFGRLKLGAQWLFLKKGIGATNLFETGAFIRTHDDEKIPNVQFEFLPLLGEMMHGDAVLGNGFQYFFSLMRPTSTGRVWIDSNDPMKPPKFVFNFLSTQYDRDVAVAGVKAIRNIISQQAWDIYRKEEIMPGAKYHTDDEILEFLKENAGTNYHPCCTCRMGIDDMAVVNHQGKLHGIENVRVVDASIMPEIVSGNLNAPVIMMAEKIADDIRGKSLPAAEVDYFRL
ncbi:choline dehydrogenase [Pseudomonas fulva]|uniref:choline dehydrogenase n=1 Tax=Pseudomonas fulva TaxID=47880 RepID=UPI00201DF1BC|nr:choline dehydrogenase [Pseudomonas fulva]UQY33021.1 choline dehydrogenase [Pseudomonas fulva]